MSYQWLRRVLFAADPEWAHETSLDFLAHVDKSPALQRWINKRYGFHHPKLQVSALGLSFPNPVGLAAGFDKNAVAPRALAQLGFGFIEVGTITPRAQPGNPRPRLFRLVEDEALINRLGFNNEGSQAVLERLRSLRETTGGDSSDPKLTIPLGINIGKNFDTANEHAAEDYCRCLRLLYPYADYFVVNVSSPNTPGLRDLQQEEALEVLLSRLQSENVAAAGENNIKPHPILLKVAPDLPWEDLQAVLEVAIRHNVSGIIATNTTIRRPSLASPHATETGGLSGRPLKDLSTEIIAAIYRWTEGRIPIIGVGGVASGDDAYEKIRAGASLVQLYTGFVYGGPSLPSQINRRLVSLLQRDGLSAIADAVGIDAHRWSKLNGAGSRRS